MQGRIGMLGLGLVAALVVGSFAQGPMVLPGETSQAVSGPESSLQKPKTNTPLHQADQGSASTPLGGNRTKSASQVGSAGQLIGFSGLNGSGSQTITLVHTGKMQIAVYHIDSSGAIRLVSSRPIDADFSLTLNPTAPLPGAIRLINGQVK